MANEVDQTPPSADNTYTQFDGGDSAVGFFYAGYNSVLSKTISSAARFTGIAINQGQSIKLARLYIWVGSRDGTAPVKIKLEGFDEDNTDDFSGGGPGSRPKTSASRWILLGK